MYHYKKITAFSASVMIHMVSIVHVIAAGATPSAPPVPQVLEPPPFLQPLWDNAFPGYDATNPTGLFQAYFMATSKFFIEAALGICLLWVIFSGFQIMYSGGGEKLSEAKQHLTWALSGVLILLFASLILRTLNSSFYQ